VKFPEKRRLQFVSQGWDFNLSLGCFHGVPEDRSGERSAVPLSVHTGRVFCLVLLRTNWNANIQEFFPASCPMSSLPNRNVDVQIV
jgi:hypothetical protein